MKSPCCTRCGGDLVDRVAPLSGRALRYCPVCHFQRIKAQRKLRPEVRAAQRKVQWALKKGRLTRQPCEVCGDPQAEAHHPDYAHALQVRWLCRLHHARIHAALRKAGALAKKGT